MHKVFIYVDSGDEAAQAEVAAGVEEVIAVYGLRVLARATDVQSSALISTGYQVELADECDEIVLNSVVIDTTAPAPTPPADWASSGDNPYWIVQFRGPQLPEWTNVVSSAGVEVIGSITDTSIFVRMTNAQASSVEALEPVQWVGVYEPLYKIDPALADEVDAVPATEMTRLANADGSADGTSSEEVGLEIEVADAGSLTQVTDTITAGGGRIDAADDDTIVCWLPKSGIKDLARTAQVMQITAYAPDEVKMERARVVTAVEFVFDAHGLDGEGEAVGVCDTGLDVGVDNETLHTDFKEFDGVTTGRVIDGIGLGGRPNPVPGQPDLWNDPDGHGTHVAGTILCNGRSIAGRPNSGVAYKARIVMQSVLDGAGGLGGIPTNLNNLFTPAYDDNGVRVHNNSWGTSASPTTYSTRARRVDQFIWRNPDMVVVFAAGNEGTDPPGVDSLVNFRSLNNRATFRNGITVGATENNRPEITTLNIPGIPSSPAQWGRRGLTSDANFPQDPLRSDLIANNPAQMAPFSSRGPTNVASGSRIKPDVVAPGTSIFAPKSGPWNAAPDISAHVAGPYDPAIPYVYMNGTSMATPHVSGICVLIRQYLKEVHEISNPSNPDRRRRRPSAALIKALLIHGARHIHGGYTGFPAIDNTGTAPGNHQGWGRVDLRRSLFSSPPTDHIPTVDNGWLPRRTIFVDDPDITLNALLANNPDGSPNPNSRRTHEVRVRVADISVPFRATLVWTDFPGAAAAAATPHPGTVLNQLGLSIERVSDGHVYNVSDPAGLLPAPAAPPGPPAPPAPPVARRNNVQQIDILTAGANPLQAGEYIIRVSAFSILSVFALPGGALSGDEQDFALVISGPISASDHLNPGTMADLPDLAFIDLRDASDGTKLHDGLAPSPQRPEGNLGSPDIWINTEEDPDPAHGADRIEAGQLHYIYIRVHNLGFADAADAEVNIFWADPATPMAYPGDWNMDGFELGNAPTNHTTVDVSARSSEVVGPFKWTPPSDREYVTLFARVEHADDPIRNSDNIRMDNNITRRDVFIQDNSTDVQGEPSAWGRFWFMVFSFSRPRDIEVRWLIYYEDIRDGEVKPLPAGVEVEIWDADPVWDDKVAQGRTVSSANPVGEPASALHLTFSTYESGERGPDLYCKVLSPASEEFEEFRQNSFFVNGASDWNSKTDTEESDGFYEEDFTGDRLGIPEPITMTIRPRGIRVHAAFEHLSIVSNEFEPFPEGVPVKIMDSKTSAPQPELANVTTDDNGEIRAVLQRREEYNPSVYFLIEKDDDVDAFVFVNYFLDNDRWDSHERQATIIARDGSVSARNGHFENVSDNSLVEEGERLRFRLSSPRILLHLRFEYYDREVAAYAPLPEGTKLEVWRDDAAATSPLITGTVGENGSAELSVPKGSEEQLDLYVRVVMHRRFETDTQVPAEVEVRSGGNIVHWDTRGHTATDGVTAGLFNDVEEAVPAAAGPLTFRIGTGAADPTHEHAAPFILKVIGDVHNWLRGRTTNNFQGITWLQINLYNSAGEGSKFQETGFPSTIHLNTGHQAHDSQQLDTGSRQNDHWNRLVIAHQYAHVVFETLFVDPDRTEVSVPNHRGFNTEDELGTNLAGRRRAFAEGFADFLAFRHLSQKARPTTDITSGGWTAQGAADLHSAIGGEMPDDTTVIRSAINPNNDTCEIRLTAMTDPRTDAGFVPYVPFRSSGYLVRFRYRSAGRSQHVNLTVKVMDNVTERASWSLRSTSTEWTTAVFSLTPEQANSIVNYGNVRLRFIADGGTGSDRRVEISWIEFELPHTERPDRDNQQLGWRGTDNNGADSSGEIIPMAIANMLWHLDNTVVGWEHGGIEEPVNQRRFLALIWNAIRFLHEDNHQVAYHLYRTIQSATLDDEDHIDGEVVKTRQEARRVFEANGMVFTRGQIHNRIAGAAARVSQEHLAAAPPTAEVWSFQVRPADRARLNIAEMGEIRSYRIDAAPSGTTNYVELDTVTPVTHANQRETINVNFTEARQTGLLQSGDHDFRVRVMDEFNTWDTFADNFDGNNDPNVTNNNTWQRDRLHAIRPVTGAGDPAITIPPHTP